MKKIATSMLTVFMGCVAKQGTIPPPAIPPIVIPPESSILKSAGLIICEETQASWRYADKCSPLLDNKMVVVINARKLLVREMIKKMNGPNKRCLPWYRNYIDCGVYDTNNDNDIDLRDIADWFNEASIEYEEGELTALYTWFVELYPGVNLSKKHQYLLDNYEQIRQTYLEKQRWPNFSKN